MKKLVLLSLAALLASTAPASAAEIVEAAGVPASGLQLPVSGLLAAQPTLRAQVISQLQLVAAPAPSLSAAAPAAALGVPALPAAAVSAAAAPTAAALPAAAEPAQAPSAAAISPEAAEIARGLLASPDLVSRHSDELSRVLGPEAVRILSGPHGDGARALLSAGPSIDPANTAQVSRIASLFDGMARGASDDGVAPVSGAASRGEAALPRSWRLSPSQQIHRSKPGEEAEALDMLANALKTMDLPPYKEKYVDEAVDAPLVAWAGLPSIWKLAIFREGGRQDPGNVQYVLDPSWFIQVPQANGTNRIYVTKGVYFEKDGKTAVVVTYKHPRRTNYFGNLLTLGAFDTDSGVPLEKNLDTPMSSSVRLEKITNDKLWTRLLLSAENARVPATRAFLLPDHPFLKRGAIPTSTRVKAGPIPASDADVRAAVVDFLASFKGPEVVVKPSGPRFHSGEGVRFFPRDQVDAIAAYVRALSHHEHMDSAGVVLLEQRLAPPAIYFRLTDYKEGSPFVYQDKKKLGYQLLRPDEIATASRHEKKDYNERVWVVRDAHDRPHTVPTGFFRAGTWGMPTSSQPKDPRDAASVVTFEIVRQALIAQYGVMTTQADVDALMRERRVIGERALKAIAANEKTLAREPGDPRQDQTDMIGLDLMYQLEDGHLVPLRDRGQRSRRRRPARGRHLLPERRRRPLARLGRSDARARAPRRRDVPIARRPGPGERA